MELQYFGANCVRLTTRKAQIVVDDNLAQLGLKTVTKPDDISLLTSKDIPAQKSRFVADMPGEYEISGVIVRGVAARGLKDETGRFSRVIYAIKAEDLKVAVFGHIFPELSDDQLEQIGLVDIAIVPVGGNNYTLDGVGALKVIKKIEPKIVIPTHYADKGIKYGVTQEDLETASKGLGMEISERIGRYKPKISELTDTTRLIVLERQ
jgi:L-ascorbate metabolism protein UlaG (beta-lactamase superfamily)